VVDFDKRKKFMQGLYGEPKLTSRLKLENEESHKLLSMGQPQSGTSRQHSPAANNNYNFSNTKPNYFRDAPILKFYVSSSPA